MVIQQKMMKKVMPSSVFAIVFWLKVRPEPETTVAPRETSSTSVTLATQAESGGGGYA